MYKMWSTNSIRTIIHLSNTLNTAAAEHAHAADRFAREIPAILERDPTRSRRLMRHSLGRAINVVSFNQAV
jgi:hypothetical protein